MLFPKKVESINTSLSIPQYCSINYLSILPSLQSVLQYCQPSGSDITSSTCWLAHCFDPLVNPVRKFVIIITEPYIPVKP